MSRFNNLNPLVAPQRLAAIYVASPSPIQPRPPAPFGTPAASPVVAPVPGSDVAPGMMQRICFVSICALLLSGVATEFTWQMMRGRPRISTVCDILIPLAWLASGTLFRGLRSTIGVLWLGFAIWLALAVPTSAWRSDSLDLVISYILKSHFLTFYIAASAVSLRRCSILMYVVVIGSLLTTLTCLLFGRVLDERFSLPDSPFFSNANDLGLQLAIGIAFMTFVFYTKNKFLKVLVIVGIPLSVMYLLQTGSRGALVAFAAMAIGTVFCGRHKVLVGAGGVMLFLICLAFVSPATRHRLMLIETDKDTAAPYSAQEESALGSQMQRQYVLRESIAFSFAHPLFGVGPGQFAVAENEEKKKRGQRGQWRGTHNSYTQVSSEVGLPAFFFYTGALILGLLSNYRRYRRASAAKDQRELAGLSFSLFLALLTYTTGTFFFHDAYTGSLAVMLGLTIAVELASRSAPNRRAVGWPLLYPFRRLRTSR
jgi:O-antigen ligase